MALCDEQKTINCDTSMSCFCLTPLLVFTTSDSDRPQNMIVKYVLNSILCACAAA